MWRSQTNRGQDRGYNRRDDRQYRDTDRYTDTYTDTHREDNYPDDRDRYPDVHRDNYDNVGTDQQYGDGGWPDDRQEYPDRRDVPYYDDRRDEGRDYPVDSDIRYRDDRVGDVYDQGIRDQDYDGGRYRDEDPGFVGDDRDLYRDDRGYDDRDQREDRHLDDQYDYRQREDTAVQYDDRAYPADYRDDGYDRDEGRRDYTDNINDRHSDTRVLDGERRGTRRDTDGDRPGFGDRRRTDGNDRRGQARGNRNNVINRGSRQAGSSSNQGRMNNIPAGRDQRLDKRGPAQSKDNRKSDQTVDKRNIERQGRTMGKGNVSLGRSAVLREDRVRSPSGRNIKSKDRSDSKATKQSGSRSHSNRTSGSVKTSSCDSKKRRSESQSSKTDKNKHKSSEKTSSNKQDRQSKVDNRDRSKDAERSRKTSENSRRSARDQNQHRSSSRNTTDIKKESVKSYGSFHDDDAISILADDDRFANETSFIDIEDVDSSKRKPEKRNDKGLTARKDDYRNRSRNSRNNDKNRSDRRKGFTTNRFGSSRYFHKSKTSRNTLGKATSQNSVRDKTQYRAEKSSDQSSRFNRFENESDPQTRNTARYGSNFQGMGTTMIDDRDNRGESSQTKDRVSIQIGRTGAVLSEDRTQDSTELYGNNRNLNEELDAGRHANRRNLNQDSAKGDANTFKQIKENYYKIRSKFLRQRYQKRRETELRRYGMKNMKGEMHDDNRERDDSGFGAGLEESVQAGMDVGQSQQLIYIPGGEFPADGQVSLVDQYGNPVINPSAVHPGSLQQMPVQFIPSNMPGDLPPGAEYVFIPFGNDPAVGPADANVNMANVPNATGNFNRNESMGQNIVTEKPVKKRATAAIKLARRRLRLQLLKKRREDLEKKVERRVFNKLMEKAKIQIEAEQNRNKETKPKPVLKRISPPASTGRQPKQSKPAPAGKGEYDNVSDVEDVTDDDDDTDRQKERRPAFRKPGQPRLGMKGRPTATRTQTDNYDDYERNDKRKVIDKGNDRQMSENRNTSRPNVRREEKFSFSKRMKLDNDYPPIKITVSNENFNQYNDDEDNDDDNNFQEPERYNNPYLGQSQNRPYKRGRQDIIKQAKDLLSEIEETDDRSHEDPGSWGPTRRGGRGGWQGKYRGGSMSRQPHMPRYQGPRNNYSNMDNRRSRWSPHNQEQGPSYGNNFPMQNNRNASPMSDFPNNNQMHKSVSSTFVPQQPMSQPQSQMNPSPSLPVQYPNVDYHFNNADPSLPPVAQGRMNMTPFGQSNFTPQMDMSQPPVAGGVAGSPAGMTGGFQQQNFQSQSPMQQSVFSTSQQQGNTGTFYNQQQQVPNMIGGINQSSNMNQQKNFQNTIQGNQQNYQMNDGSQFQQRPFVVNSGPSTMQQQQQQQQIPQQQSVLGGVITVGSQAQKTYPSSQQNQQPITGTITSGQNTGQQGYIAARAVSANNPVKEAMPSVVKNVPGTASTNIGYAVRPQIVSSVRAGVVKVPGGSIQAGSVAVLQTGVGMNVVKGGQQREGQREMSNTGDGGRPRMTPARGRNMPDEMEDDFGELLCNKCDKVFYSESVMRRHNKWHMLAESGIQDLRCDKCMEGFTSPVAFSGHLWDNHKATSWRCEDCKIVFVSKIAMQRHNYKVH